MRPILEKMSYLARPNLEYIESLLQSYEERPDSIPLEWQRFFEGMDFAKNSGGGTQLSQHEIDVYRLIQAYRDYGCLQAQLNPLTYKKVLPSPYLQLSKYNLKTADLEKTFQVGSLIGKSKAKLKEIIAQLEKLYCGTISIQVADCAPEVRDWFVREFESAGSQKVLTKEEKLETFKALLQTDALERFIHSRYVGVKRFSIEGADSMIPMLELMAQRARQGNAEEIIFGMAHRGRINTLINVMGKPAEKLFAEFDSRYKEVENYDGDVKYHMGYSRMRETAYGEIKMQLAFNPSHLECVNAVVEGMSRAAQHRTADEKRKKIIPLLIHGDAAFAGQGVVAETLQMSQLQGYKTGGTIHVIIDNQVGFTANPEDGRSTPFSSDMAKIIRAPVVHVNGDDTEACLRAMELALKFRQEFGQDVVVDLICYRRYGHNEGDEPMFTQPLMYEFIKTHPTPREIYAKKLAQENVLSAEDAQKAYDDELARLQKLLESSRSSGLLVEPPKAEGVWTQFRRSKSQDFEVAADTKVSREILDSVSQSLFTVPKDFNIFAKAQKLLNDRLKAYADNQLDWGLAEMLAYGSLIHEGTDIRLSGQDAGRGTFSHRHAVYTDVKTGAHYNPFSAIKSKSTGDFQVYDSFLSEFAVMGFEYGYTLIDPESLVIWEGQYGDFANGAQVIIDQYMSAGEMKWMRQSGLVLLLPHGYEGGGAEHSSARFERFLQMCAQDNMQVMNLTLPSQIFHALRRQVRRDFRKPLVVMSPKWLLRHPKAKSSLTDLTQGRLLEVLDDPFVQDPAKVERLVLCTGKLYFEMDAVREGAPATKATASTPDKPAVPADPKVALIRIEQLYPFPKTQLATILTKYKNVKKITWAQEEPRNMGAYSFIEPRLRELFAATKLDRVEFVYAGRGERAAPATGSPARHKIEQDQLIAQALK